MKKIKQHFIVTTIVLSLFAFIALSNPSQTRAQSPSPASAPAPAPKSGTKVTSSDKYTVLAPLPCIESAPTTYIDSAGNTQTNPGIQCGTEGNGSLKTQVDFKTYVQYMMNLLIALSAVTAVVMIVWGGIEYMWSNSYSDKKMGLDRAKNAVYGLLLVLTSYIILRTIDPRLVEIPNTLVPQIEYKTWLTKDANTIFMEQIEDQVNKYTLKGVEIGKELKETLDKKKELQKQIDVINAKMAAFGTPPDSDDPEYQKLLVERQVLENEIGNTQMDVLVIRADSQINGVVKDAIKYLLDPIYNDYSTEEKLRLIESQRKLVNAFRDSTSAEIQQLRKYDSNAVNDLANYAEAMIDLTEVNVVTVDGERLRGLGPRVVKFTDIKISLDNDGKVINVLSGSGKGSKDLKTRDLLELRKQILPIFEKVQSAVNNNIKDQKIKAELQKELDNSKALFEAKFEADPSWK